jgi:hypothetical protein
VNVLEFSGGEREDLPYGKYCMRCLGMYRDTTKVRLKGMARTMLSHWV